MGVVALLGKGVRLSSVTLRKLLFELLLVSGILTLFLLSFESLGPGYSVVYSSHQGLGASGGEMKTLLSLV